MVVTWCGGSEVVLAGAGGGDGNDDVGMVEVARWQSHWRGLRLELCTACGEYQCVVCWTAEMRRRGWNRDGDAAAKAKTIAEMYAMLKLPEKGILKKAKTPTVLAIREDGLKRSPQLVSEPRGSRYLGLFKVFVGVDFMKKRCVKVSVLEAVKKTLSKLKAQSPLKISPKKAPVILKPFKESKYCGFNDHHSNHCGFYPGCEVYGSIAYEPSNCPKKHPNSRRPKIANRKSEIIKETNLCEYICAELPQKESGPKVVFRDDSSGDIEGKMENLNEVRVKELRSDNGTGSIIVKRHGKTSYDVFRGRSLDISYFYVFGCPVHIHNHRDHLGKFDEKADDGFFLGYSLVAKAFRVFNIKRQEIEETVHVTFNEDDEAISQTSTEGDETNFNENKSFPNDEFLEPRSEITQCLANTKYFPYIPAYECTSPSALHTLQNSFPSEEQTEFTIADEHPTVNELDNAAPAYILESAEPQDYVLNEQISDEQPAPIISPSAEEILQNPVP
ncbi:retrovirus-related pol polyprotein from transposon TNT 1-94 [Tanacetum coccineum]